MKMPEPIIDPATSIVESNNPKLCFIRCLSDVPSSAKDFGDADKRRPWDEYSYFLALAVLRVPAC
jgi:hypothetical protein